MSDNRTANGTGDASPESLDRADLDRIALDTLLERGVAGVLRRRDWTLLARVAEIARADADTDLAMSDPERFRAIRDAVTWYHLAGWSRLDPVQIRALIGRDPASPAHPVGSSGQPQP